MKISSDSGRALLGTSWTIFILLATHLSPAADEPAALGISPGQDRPRVDRERMIQDLSILAHDSMEGRRAGTIGIERARRFLVAEFQDRGFSRIEGERAQVFQIGDWGGAGGTGVNIIGMIEGRESPDRYLVISAHYDHLGIRNGEIYNGADDNASGTAALLALGRLFADQAPLHSLVLVAFDSEEGGLGGARAFVSDPPVPLESILMNVNLDMVSHSERGELYAAGTYHYPFLAPLVEEVATRAEVSLLTGHDTPNASIRDDWTNLSDHGPFHQMGIPFIYFGVEDHADYHRPSDTLDSVTLDFYVRAVDTIADFIQVADREIAALN